MKKVDENWDQKGILTKYLLEISILIEIFVYIYIEIKFHFNLERDKIGNFYTNWN